MPVLLLWPSLHGSCWYQRDKAQPALQPPLTALLVQERFGKPPEVPRMRSDDEEGLSWASAAALPSDFCASLEDANHQPLGPYLPLMGSLGPDADAADVPDLQLCAEVRARSTVRPHPCIS